VERNAQRASSPTLKQLNPMNNTMHKVILHTSAEQLGELVALVTLLPDTLVLSTELVGQLERPVVEVRPIRIVGRNDAGNIVYEARGNGGTPTKLSKRYGNKVNTDEEERDPRLVYQVDEHGNARVDIAESLLALNLSAAIIAKMKTKQGTSEHRVKMAIASSRRFARNLEEATARLKGIPSTSVGPAHLHGRHLKNRRSAT
jgi:hypothetical protein